MAREGIHFSPEGKKTFIPLEINPNVFNNLIYELGVSSSLSFYDVYSVDDPDLLSTLPRPVMALICIIPADVYYKVREAEGTKFAKDGMTYDGAGAEEPIVWYHQTIGHACGLIAMLHCVANGEAREFVEKGTTLHDFILESTPLKPTARAACLYDSSAMERAHMKVAETGDSPHPSAAEPCPFHFQAYVKGKDGHLWELEGIPDGPLDLGQLEEDADMLSLEALGKGFKRFLNASDGNANFSLIALARRPVEE